MWDLLVTFSPVCLTGPIGNLPNGSGQLWAKDYFSAFWVGTLRLRKSRISSAISGPKIGPNAFGTHFC
jgi:hypothetical protein